MMELEEFRAWAHRFVDWMADYYRDIEQFPVKSQVGPGEILKKLPEHAPEQARKAQIFLLTFQPIPAFHPSWPKC